MADPVVTLRTPEDFASLRARLRDPTPVAQSVGALLVRESNRAFSEQKLGEYEWPARYPEQGEPFVNYAAVLAAANRGQEPISRFFDRRPALLGTSALRKSVAWALRSASEVEVGSALPYAGLHQFGGDTRIEVSQIARDTLKAWAFKKGTASATGLTDAAFLALKPGARKVGKRKKPPDPRVRKVLALSYLHNWSQTVIRRPFIGVTPRAGLRISQAVAFWTATGEQTAT